MPGAASEGLRSAKMPAVREAPQPRRISGLPVRLLRCLVVSFVVVSSVTLVTEHLSNESGRFEVYVRPFPGPGGKWQVSMEGGWKPMWSKQRNEILFSTPSGTVMVAPYSVSADSFRPERPQSWSQQQVRETEETSRVLDLHPDGERVAAIMADPGQPDVGTTRRIVFIQNFFEDLRRLAPAGGK